MLPYTFCCFWPLFNLLVYYPKLFSYIPFLVNLFVGNLKLSVFEKNSVVCFIPKNKLTFLSTKTQYIIGNKNNIIFFLNAESKGLDFKLRGRSGGGNLLGLTDLDPYNNNQDSDDADPLPENYNYGRRRSRAVLYHLSGTFDQKQKNSKSKLQLNKVVFLHCCLYYLNLVHVNVTTFYRTFFLYTFISSMFLTNT